MNETMGNIIMRLRKEREVTQDQLASALGISFQAVSKWENGLSCPDLSMLPLLADFFSVSIDTLFGRAAQAETLPAVQPAPAETPFLPWPDDDSFRAVLFHGHELIGSQERREGVLSVQRAFSFQYEGPAKDVFCAFDLQIDGTVSGNARAGGDLSCDDVGGGVSAEGDVSCDNVGGGVSAGGDVTCDTVNGPVSTAGDVNCDDIYGNVEAGGDVACANVTGDVGAGGDVVCGNVQGGVSAGGDWNAALSGLGATVSDAVKKGMKKGWSFHKSWPFGKHEAEVHVDLDWDEDDGE